MIDVKPQLHSSMLDMLSKCGVQFQRRYGYRFGVWHKEEIIMPSAALGVGMSVHYAVEADLREKIERGILLQVENVKDLARDKFTEIAYSGLYLSESDANNIDEIIGAATDQAIALAELHHNECAPLITPVAVEEKFVLEMPGYPFDLAGKKDVREADAIGDTKTAKRSPASDAAESLQMGIYALAEKVLRGKYPAMVYQDHLVKNKTPKAVRVTATPDPRWINPVLKRIERFAEIMTSVKEGRQAFTPAESGSWVCTSQYCGYHATCPFWSGREK